MGTVALGATIVVGVRAEEKNWSERTYEKCRQENSRKMADFSVFRDFSGRKTKNNFFFHFVSTTLGE